ncbi:MAG: MBG domain-containing protein, partial [Dokdonella sp.]
ATTTPTGLAYSVTYDGSVTPPVDAGSYAIVATVTTPSYTGAASGTLVIAPSTGVVTFGTTNVTFDGQPHTTTAVISQEPADTAACILTATIGDYPRIDAGSTTVSAVCAGSNYTASGSTTLIVSRKPVAIALAGLGSFPYDNAAHAATATVNDAVAGFPATAEVTYDGNAAAPVNVGTYAVLASLDAASQINYSATPSNGSIVIGSANASVTLANLAQAYDGTDRIVTATTVPASLATSITYDGSVSPPVNAGSYTVVATITEAGYSGSTSGTLVVAKASATIGLSDLTQAYDGQPKPVTVATTPAGLAIAVSYDGSATAPIAVGTYAVLAIITDANHTGSTSGTLHIVAAGADAIAANGTTTFAGTAGQPIQGALPSVRVTDSGGNPVAGTVITFAAAASNGTLSGATQITDANGVATLGGWTLDPTPGTDTVVASAAGVIGAVTFTASAGVSTDALTVTITDARNYAQLFTALTYTITIGNATSSSVSGISVTDSLPTELDVNSAHWQCIGINGGTCSASALGDLSDTVSLPSGSSVVYLLSATVIGGSSDTIVNTIDATGPNGPASATDTTSIVLFRNGFEAGSDGAQRIGDPSDVLGVIDAQTPLDLNVEPATLRSLQRITIASDSALRIEAIRIDSTVWVRLVANAGAGEKASLWSPMTGKRLSLRMEQTTVTLAGAVDALSVTVQAAAALTIRGGH